MSEKAPDVLYILWDEDSIDDWATVSCEGYEHVEYRRADLVESVSALREAMQEIERLRGELDAANQHVEICRSNLAALEDEKNAYIDYVGDALGQAADGETLWDAAQRVLSERDRYRVIVDRLLESADSNPFGTVGHFCEHGPASVEIGSVREILAAVEQGEAQG